MLCLRVTPSGIYIQTKVAPFWMVIGTLMMLFVKIHWCKINSCWPSWNLLCEVFRDHPPSPLRSPRLSIVSVVASGTLASVCQYCMLHCIFNKESCIYLLNVQIVMQTNTENWFVQMCLSCYLFCCGWSNLWYSSFNQLKYLSRCYRTNSRQRSYQVLATW